MPMNLPPQGGLPSPMTQAPANAGGATSPQGNHGNVQAALVKVKSAYKLLEEALPMIPFGTEEHNNLADVLTKLSKSVKKASENPQLQIAALQAAAKNTAQQAPMAAMMRQFSQNQGAGQPPAMQQPQA